MNNLNSIDFGDIIIHLIACEQYKTINRLLFTSNSHHHTCSNLITHYRNIERQKPFTLVGNDQHLFTCKWHFHDIDDGTHNNDAFSGRFLDNGAKYWLHDGKIHRGWNLPAIIDTRSKQWHSHGKLHRVSDQPAVIQSDGALKWLKYGKLHRLDDKPAIIHPGFFIAWYVNGKLYRSGNRQSFIRFRRSTYGSRQLGALPEWPTCYIPSHHL